VVGPPPPRSAIWHWQGLLLSLLWLNVLSKLSDSPTVSKPFKDRSTGIRGNIGGDGLKARYKFSLYLVLEVILCLKFLFFLIYDLLLHASSLRCVLLACSSPALLLIFDDQVVMSDQVANSVVSEVHSS